MEKNIKKRKKAWNLDLSGEEPKYVLNKNLISHKRKTGSFSIKEWGEIGFVISYVFLTPVVAHLIAPPIIDDTEENVQVIEREEQYKSPKIEEIKGPFEEIEIDIEELTPTTQYEKARYLNDNEPEITRFHTTFNKNGYNFGQKGAFEYLLTDRGQVTSQGYHNIQILDSDKFLGELGSSCKYLMDEKGDIIATSSEHCVDMMYVLNLELDK